MTQERTGAAAGGWKAAIASLAIAGGMASACALPKHVEREAAANRCGEALTDANAGEWHLAMAADCTLSVRDASGKVLGKASLADTPSGADRSSLRRVVATSKWLFVLRGNPGRLEGYQLPALTPLQVLGSVTFRDPADFEVREEPGGGATAYILDNSRGAEPSLGPDMPEVGSQVLRVGLTHHVSARREVIIARAIDRFAVDYVQGGQWRALEAIDLVGGEVRVVVRENGGRHAEYFTLDGILLEREQIAGSH